MPVDAVATQRQSNAYNVHHSEFAGVTIYAEAARASLSLFRLSATEAQSHQRPSSADEFSGEYVG
jgi:hypothetical protein